MAQGLKIKALAKGLQHPRSIYVLPNGDVLVVESKSPGTEPIQRPKTLIMGLIQKMATSGGDAPSNRITLLRDANGDSVPETLSVFLDHLNSPFGVALVGNDFYVANTDAIVKYPYKEGDTRITAPGTVLTELPGGPIDHHWTKAMVASADGSSSMSVSAPTATSSRMALAPSAIVPPSGRSIARADARACSRRACAIRLASLSSRRAGSSGPSSTSATSSAPTSCRIT